MTMELLQCDHREKIKTGIYTHTQCQRLGSSLVIVVGLLRIFYTRKIILETCCYTSEIYTY